MKIGTFALGGLFAIASILGAGEQVEVWLTTESLSFALEAQAETEFVTEEANGTAVVVEIDESIQYQSIDGWGVSITDASAWLLTNRLSSKKRSEVMEDLFGASGIGLSMLRQPIGATDFNWELYSYADDPVDGSLNGFSIERDLPYIVPRVKEALVYNPQMKIIASPWSPPGWMKTSNSLIKGTLRNEHYQSNADYFVKFIQAYEDEGIPIYAVTPQNEPGYTPSNYPGMFLSASQQVNFIGNYLGPALDAAGLSRVKVICHDHNYDGLSIPQAILSSDAAKYVDGTGFHHYGGPIQAMDTLNAEYPEKGIWFTEGGFGDWNSSFDNIVHEMIEIPRNWAKSIILWNAALDENDQPAILGPDNTNHGMVTIRSDRLDDVSYTVQYYFLGHLSKFVRPGATRVKSPSWIGSIETVAFVNTDGARSLVVANRNHIAKEILVKWGSKSFRYTVPARSMMTFKWRPQSTEYHGGLLFEFDENDKGVVRFEIDTKRVGPLFNVKTSEVLAAGTWRHTMPIKLENEDGRETWEVSLSTPLECRFVKVDVWR